MTPTIVAFSEFLLDAEPSFKTLRRVEVIKRDNSPIITCTSRFAEAQIMLDGKRYILSIPLKGEIDPAVERLCLSLERASASFLTEYRLLKGEVTLKGSMGQEICCDVILHAIPDGERIDRAAAFVATSRLRAALELLKCEMKSIGFIHRNLKPENLIYGEDGRLYPIRYNYARFEASESEVESDLRNIEEFMAGIAEVAEIGEYTSPTEYDNLLPYDKVYPMQDTMRRVCKGGLYGYLDCNNQEIITPQYIYAENFFENRAVVQTSDGKMGVIDHSGHWVIEPEYDMIGFENGRFEARIGEEWTELDYLGIIIK